MKTEMVTFYKIFTLVPRHLSNKLNFNGNDVLHMTS